MNEHFETLQLHAGQAPDTATRSRAVPIYQTTSFTFESAEQAANLFALNEDGYIYSRFHNPTNDVLEQRIAALEGGVGCLAVASGSAATVMAVLNMMGAGSHIVATSRIYGGTHNLFANTLPQYGITTSFVDTDEPENIRKAMRKETRAVFLETVGNPSANLCDVDAIARIAHEYKVPVIVDSTFATPYLYRPFEHGADIVVHSATKYIGGHGTTIAGLIVDSGNFDWAASGKFESLVKPDPGYHGMSYTEKMGRAAYIGKCRVQLQRDLGATLAPLSAFLLLMGVETLSLRMERHVENGRAVARYLAGHHGVDYVNHPELEGNAYNALAKRDFPRGIGGIFTFGVKGGIEAGRRFIGGLTMFSHLANVADAKSLVIHPASTTHSQLSPEDMAAAGILPNMIRLSIGLEHIDDIIADLERGLAAAKG